MEEQLTDENCASLYKIKNYMEKAGFKAIAASIAVTELQRKKLIIISREQDSNGYDYTGCRLTTDGESWVLDNQDKVQMRYVEDDNSADFSDMDLELPF